MILIIYLFLLHIHLHFLVMDSVLFCIALHRYMESLFLLDSLHFSSFVSKISWRCSFGFKLDNILFVLVFAPHPTCDLFFGTTLWVVPLLTGFCRLGVIHCAVYKHRLSSTLSSHAVTHPHNPTSRVGGLL